MICLHQVQEFLVWLEILYSWKLWRTSSVKDPKLLKNRMKSEMDSEDLYSQLLTIMKNLNSSLQQQQQQQQHTHPVHSHSGVWGLADSN